jgi:hypothetical protein
LDVLFCPSSHDLLYQNYRPPDLADDFDSHSVVWATMALLLGATAAWLLTAQRYARVAFLVMATCVAMPNIWEGLLIWQYAYDVSGSLENQWKSLDMSSWIALSMPVRWALWLAGNYVYLLGQHAQRFFLCGQ